MEELGQRLIEGRYFFSKKNRIIGRLSLLLTLLFVLLTGQQNAPPPSEAARALQSGREQWKAGLYDEAATFFQEAEQLAQANQEPFVLVAALHHQGKYLAQQGQAAGSRKILDRAIAMAEVVGPLYSEVLLARCERAELQGQTGDFQAAVDTLIQVAQDGKALPQTADSIRAIIFHRLGNAYGRSGQPDSTIRYCQQAIDIRLRIYPPDHLTIAYSENSLGIAYVNKEAYEEAISHYHRAEKILTHHLPPGHTQLFFIKSNIAVLYMELGLFWKALDLHRENLQYLESFSPIAQLNVLFNYASCLRLVGDNQESLLYLNQAEALLTESPSLYPQGMAMVHSEKSGIFAMLEQYESALTYNELAMASYRELYGEEDESLILEILRKGRIESLRNQPEASVKALKAAVRLSEQLDAHDRKRGWAWEYLGEAQLELGNPQEALFSLQQAAEVYDTGEQTKQWNLGDIYRRTATAWRELGNWDSSLHFHQKAWEALLPEIPFQLAADSTSWQYWNRYHLGEVLAEQGSSLEWLDSIQGTTTHQAAALACYEGFLAVTDSQRHYFQAQESQQQGLQNQLPALEKALRICHRMYQDSGEPAYLHRAFALVEKSKANQLRDHLQGQQALRFSGIPDSLIEREQYYRQRLSALQQSGTEEEERSEEEQQTAQTESFLLREGYRAFLDRLEETYPRYYQLKYSAESFQPTRLEKLLSSDQALFSYFWGEKQHLVFSVFRGTWRMEIIDHAEALPLWIDFVSQPPGQQPFSDSLGVWGDALRAKLLPGLSPEMKQLILIPDGTLGYLPFESLLLNRPDGQDFRTWPYLVQQHSSLYANSVALWMQQSETAAGKSASYLGFAPGFHSGGNSDSRAVLGPLKFNQKEVEEAASLMNGQVLLGSAASERSLKQLDQRAYVLHFATHALADEKELMQSRLFFEEDSSSEEDGILYAQEIYGLRINSPLTVLSACQTGKGPLLRGEGVMSLARAFQYAGSQRVLTTLWQADDRASSSLNQAFFKELADGVSIEEALQQGKLSWLRQSDAYHCHPYFWSGYVMIGAGGVIEPAHGSIAGWVILSLLGVAVAFVGVKRIANSRKLTRLKQRN